MAFGSNIVSSVEIGGVLAVDLAPFDRPGTENDVAVGEYLYFYDANGNVGQLIDYADSAGSNHCPRYCQCKN